MKLRERTDFIAIIWTGCGPGCADMRKKHGGVSEIAGRSAHVSDTYGKSQLDDPVCSVWFRKGLEND